MKGLFVCCNSNALSILLLDLTTTVFLAQHVGAGVRNLVSTVTVPLTRNWKWLIGMAVLSLCGGLRVLGIKSQHAHQYLQGKRTRHFLQGSVIYQMHSQSFSLCQHTLYEGLCRRHPLHYEAPLHSISESEVRMVVSEVA